MQFRGRLKWRLGHVVTLNSNYHDYVIRSLCFPNAVEARIQKGTKHGEGEKLKDGIQMTPTSTSSLPAAPYLVLRPFTMYRRLAATPHTCRPMSCPFNDFLLSAE